MASEKANKIKAIIKGTAPKSTFGTDPRDPWSTKSNINESGDLERYLRSRGINPKFVSTDSKISHSKSGEFAKWKRDHQFEEVQNEQTATEKHTPTEIKAHELQKKTHKHNEIGAVKSEAWDQPDYEQSIKNRQAEADKKAKEQSKEGVNKLLAKYRERNKKEHHVEEVELEEGKMGDLAGEIGRHLDKHIDDYKTHGGAEHLGYKTIDTAKKLVKSHGLHPDHAQKFVNDYVEKRLHEEQLDEISTHTLNKAIHKRYQQADAAPHGSPEQKKALKSMGHMNRVSLKRTQAKLMHMAKHDPEAYKKSAQASADSDVARGWSIESTHVCPVCGCTPCNCTHITEDKFGKPTPSLQEIAKKHKISMDELKNAHEEGVKVESEHTNDKSIADEIARDHLNEKPDYYKKLKKYVEDVYQDPQAATQTVFDGATNTEDTTQNRKREMSKSARMIKALYKKHKMVKEDMYDHEKEDKSVATYGKKPKLNTTDKESSFGENKPDAAAILSGGTTLTGEPRDTIEIDPMMKNRPTAPEGDEVKDKKKSKQ